MDYAKAFQNNPNLKPRRRKLRNLPTKAEYVLWQEIRRRRLGYLFRRQFGIDNFIVDFYCHELKLIIEVDGPIHNDHKEYDRWREDRLKKLKYNVIRFKNDEILFKREEVIEILKTVITLLEGKIKEE